MKNLRKLMIIFLAAFTILLGQSISGFAAENCKINNTVLEFNKIVYVSPSGNDNSGDGTDEKPFQSLLKCLNYLNDNNLRENVAIVMDDGDYDWTDILTGYADNINSKFKGMKVSFIAKNSGKTYFHSNNGLEMLVLEQDASWRIQFKFYGVIFHNIGQGKEGGYTCLGGDSWTNEYYNCVFDNLSKLGGWNRYDNLAGIKAENCLFYNCEGSVFYTQVPLIGKAINCATTNEIIEPSNGTKTTCLTNASVDSNYCITSDGWKNKGTGTNPDGTQADIGVYGGEFAWGKWTVDITDPKIDTITNTAYARGDNTNNAYGKSTIVFNGTADTRLSVTKTADVEEVWVDDIFTYTITVTNTGLKTAKSVAINDAAPDHIEFMLDDIVDFKDKIDSSSTSKKILINLGDIAPSETVKINVPVKVVA